MNAGARVSRLWEQVSALLQLRLRQARTDAKLGARSLITGLIFGLVGVGLLLVSLPLLVTVVILALATAMAPWLAALVVLGAILLVAAGLLLLARARLRWRGVSIVDDLRADWRAIREKVGESR